VETRPLSRRIWPPPPNFVRWPKISRKQIRPGRRWRFRAAEKKHFSTIELNAFLMTSSAQNNSAIYSIDLTNNLKQPRAFVTQIAFLHIFSGLFCAMHYFMAAL